MTYKIIVTIVRFLFNIINRTTIIGQDKIPDSGSCIVVANHLGRLDAILIFDILRRDDLIVVIAEKYQKYALYRILAKVIDGIWIDRFNADFGALRIALRRLRQGGLFVIAPEGTRSPTKALIPPRLGAAYVASKTGYPIYPIGITGTEDKDALASLKKYKRIKIKAIIGEPFTVPKIDRTDRDGSMKANADEMMCQIGALLPSQYRGVYADHPRLKELLKENNV